MTSDIKVKVIIGLGVVIVVGTLFALWRTTSIKLSNTQEQLVQVTEQLETVNKENNNLVQYNKRKDTEIKQLEQSYQERLNSIPADLCGDTKPSKEMLEFFKQGR